MSPKMSKRSSAQARGQQALMRRWIALGIVVVLALIAFAVFALRSGETAPTASATLKSEISVEEAYQKYQQGAFLLDVRQPEEWAEYHIPNTTLIPLNELPNRLNELPRDQEIVVVCRSGNRSQVGRDILLQAGFPRVTSMRGGLRQWSALGYPIEGSQP